MRRTRSVPALQALFLGAVVAVSMFLFQFGFGLNRGFHASSYERAQSKSTKWIRKKERKKKKTVTEARFGEEDQDRLRLTERYLLPCLDTVLGF